MFPITQFRFAIPLGLEYGMLQNKNNQSIQQETLEIFSGGFADELEGELVLTACAWNTLT